MIEKIKGFEIYNNEKSSRIINIDISDEILNKLILIFSKIDITSLEYKPFTRFTIAKNLDDLSNNRLSKLIENVIKDRNTGCIIVKPKKAKSKINEDFLVKFSTAISHLIGVPNHDAMAGKFYARFHIRHEDKSDSYLRKAYTEMALHTDGTYVKEKTDWLLMSKLEEKNTKGGETVLLHLDDWEDCEELFKDPIAKENFIWGSPKSKNIDYKVEHPIFSKDKNGKAQISYIDQFPEPQNMVQGTFLQKLSETLENSKNKIVTNLPVGSTIIANNYFWLHGRKAFKKDKKLSRELLRIRGKFEENTDFL